MKSIPLSLLFVPLLCATPLSGQETAQHTCRILFPDRPAGAPTSLHLFDGTSSRPVDLPGMNLSPVHKLPAGPLNLSLLPTPLNDSLQLPPGAPSVSVSQETADFYLLVFSNPANQVAPVRLQIVDAGAEGFLPGHILWINLTSDSVEGTLGSEKFNLPPDARVVVAPPRKDAGAYPASISYRPAGKNTTFPLCQTQWVHQPGVRQLGVIYKAKQGSRRPGIAVFPDFRSSP